MAYTLTQLQPGDILLTVHDPQAPWWDALFDGLISWSTDSRWVHAAIVGEHVVFDPLWRVDVMPLKVYATNGTIFRPAGATPQQRREAVAWAKAHMGQRYGVGELVDDAAKFDLHWVPRLRHHLRHFTCSGFVAMSYQQAGYPLTYAVFPAPSDLAASPRLTLIS